MLLYADYRSLIIQDYQKKRAKNALHTGLIHPTPAGLRDACLLACNDRFSAKDERTLKEFFGQGSDKAACLRAIERLNADKIKPLANFLKKLTGNPERKNIELLAWLIDFQPRPFVFNELPRPDETMPRPDESPKKGPTGEPTAVTRGPIQDEEQISPIPSSPKLSIRKLRTIIVALVLIIAVATGIAIYWPSTKKPQKYILTGHEACMFWDEDHYQPVSCAQKIDNTQVVALDSEMIKNVHKITRPDTITLNAIGSVWYVKYRGELEYYTDSGSHPLDPNLRLKPITPYMIRKYIHPAP